MDWIADFLVWCRKAWDFMKALFSLPHRVEALEAAIPDGQFDVADELLLGGGFKDRQRGAMDLWRLARRCPCRFHVDAMHVFNAALAYPLHYAKGHAKSGVDPHSPDAVYIMDAIMNRSPEQVEAEKRAGYTFALNPNSPFEYKDGRFYFGGECISGNDDD